MHRYDPAESEKILQLAMQADKRFDKVLYIRQHQRGKYIVDLYFPNCDLVVELDEAYHSKPKIKKYDEFRELYLKRMGCVILRFQSSDTINNPKNILDIIFSKLIELSKTRWKSFTSKTLEELKKEKNNSIIKS